MAQARRANPATSGIPEWQLLVACARTQQDEVHRERIFRLLREPLDWDRFLSEVSRHGLEALAERQLSAVADGMIPAAQAASLGALARSKSQNSLLYAARLVEILDLLASAGVTAIPYKGPTLGALAYGSFALRSFTDLDLIVPQRHLLRAAQLLIASGYTAYPDPTAPEQAHFLARFHPGQYAFASSLKPPQVELHTENTLRYVPFPLDWPGLVERLTTVSFGGRKVRTFSVEDTLVLLCVHGTKHFWERLCWICDIAELTQSQKVDWELGEGLARKAGCRRMWLLGLSLASRLLDAPLPATVRAWIDSDGQVPLLRRRIETRLAGDDRTVVSALERLVFRLQSHESLTVGVRQCWRTATHPTEEDWKNCRLPDWAAPLYLVLRPWWLLCEHGFGLRRRPVPGLASFIPTPHKAIDELLRFAAVQDGDVLYDVGCGDGRIVIRAAKRFGIRAVGIDIDPRRIAEARRNARRDGVEHLVEFHQEDALSVDLKRATVVALYLSEAGTLALAGRLREQLRPGTRIISRDADIPGWKPFRKETIQMEGSGHISTLFQWRIPLKFPCTGEELSASCLEEVPAKGGQAGECTPGAVFHICNKT
jgi:SAM-dependent methyltransferase